MTELDERDRLRAENKALRVRLDAARQMIGAAVRLAEGAADMLIEAASDSSAFSRATVDPGTREVFGLPIHGSAHPSGAEPTRVDKGTAYADPLASIPSSRLRD